MPEQPPDLTTVDLEDAIRRHTSPRRRALQVGGVVALVVVMLGIVAFDLLRAHSAPVAVVPPAVLVSNVSFGTVTLNGQRLNGPPPVVLPLHDGTNRITLSAPPFAPRSCQLTWHDNALADIGDCSAEGRDTSVFISGRTISPGLIVALPLSDDDLSETSAARARRAIADDLTRVRLDPVTLAPGESIATGGFYPVQVNTMTARAPLVASVSFTLPNQTPAGPFPSACDSTGGTICAGTPLTRSDYPASVVWAITLVAAYHWTYADAQGNVVATSMDYPFIPSVNMLLAADGAGGWTVADGPGANATEAGAFGTWSEKLCGAGESMAEANTQDSQGRASGVQDKGVQGCELFVRTDDGTVYRFIWRCGVLLAYDAQASRLMPGVPIALPSVAKQFTA